MTVQDANRWAEDILDADYPRETLKLRIANGLMDATQQTTFQHVAFWQAVQIAHERSAAEHVELCTLGSDCEVTRTKRHVAGLIEAQLRVFEKKVSEK